MKSIPFQDLQRLHQTIGPELQKAFQDAVEKSAFIQGAPVKNFERDFAEYLGVKHTIGVANGTDALEIALEALNLKPGESVITPSMTFAATAEAIIRQGGIPVFAEIDPTTLCLTAKNLDEAMTRATSPVKGVIVVHLYGRSCKMDEISTFCKSKNLFLIEDCAQAHGAKSNHQTVGTFGEFGTFSFYPGKNLGALGDAGAIVTSRDDLAEKVKMIRDHGRIDKYDHQKVGRNSRMDALQASFLSVKLKHLFKWTASRRRIANLYYEQLQSISEIEVLEKTKLEEDHVYHLFVIKVKNGKRDILASFLKDKGIEVGVHYPIPLHRQRAFETYSSGLLAVTESASSEILSLPMDPLMSAEEVAVVTKTIQEFYLVL